MRTQESAGETGPMIRQYDRDIEIREKLSLFAQNPQGEPLTWGATPMVSDGAVVVQQARVKEQLEALFDPAEVPAGVTPALAQYMDIANAQRTAQREARNIESFYFRGVTDMRNYPMELLEPLSRATQGAASPAELLYVAQLFQIPTIELASLTHPYGKRIEQLKPMRQAVREAIAMHGGVVTDQPEDVYKIKNANEPFDSQKIQGLLMTRKRIIGTLPDGTYIKERSSFIVAIDKLPEGYAEAIRSIPLGGNYWSNRVRRAKGDFYKLIPGLLDENQFDVALPVSTTIVAQNDELVETYLSDEAKRRRRNRHTILGNIATKESAMFIEDKTLDNLALQ